IIWALLCAVCGLVAVMMRPFEESVEVAAAGTGEPIGSPQHHAGGRIADDYDAGFFAGCQVDAMTGKAGTEIVTTTACGPCGTDMLPDRGEVYTLPLRSLMAVTGIGRCRFGAMAERTGQTVGQIVMTLITERGQYRHVMS